MSQNKKKRKNNKFVSSVISIIIACQTLAGTGVKGLAVESEYSVVLDETSNIQDDNVIKDDEFESGQSTTNSLDTVAKVGLAAIVLILAFAGGNKIGKKSESERFKSVSNELKNRNTLMQKLTDENAELLANNRKKETDLNVKEQQISQLQTDIKQKELELKFQNQKMQALQLNQCNPESSIEDLKYKKMKNAAYVFYTDLLKK